MKKSNVSIGNQQSVCLCPVLLVGWLLFLIGFVPLIGQETAVAEPGAFRTETHVTAVDLLVEVEAGAWRQWATGKVRAEKLGLDDFAILVDGERLPVVAVEVPPGEDPEDPRPAVEPWRLVIWLDLTLVGSDELRWGVSRLQAEAAGLVALGEVEVVAVEESPRRLLAPTRDAEALEAVLAQVALFPEGNDQLASLRAEAIEEWQQGPIDAEVAEVLASEERRLVTERQDLLLTWLAGEGQPAVSRRALFLINGGFDLEPEEFYQQLLGEESGAVPEPPPGLRPATELFASTLASYGWVTFPLLRPEPELLVEGLRLGKWLFRGLGPHLAEPIAQDPDQAALDESTERANTNRLGRLFFFGLHGTREERRDPDLADAYLELGRAFEGQEKNEDAAEAYQKALYHFAEDPRTAEEQAVAKVGLSRVLARAGHTPEAEQAREEARRLDPEAAAELAPSSAFRDPGVPLALLAGTTGGSLIRGEVLGAVLESLARRVRVTYQVDGLPTGELRPLQLEFHAHRPEVLKFPAWTRSSTPSSVAEARSRLLLTGADVALLLSPSTNPLELIIDVGSASGELLEIRVPATAVEPPGGVSRPSRLRWTVAYGGYEGMLEIEHGAVRTWRFDVGDFNAEVPLHPPADAEVVSVLVEDLVTGRWNAQLVDL